VRVQIVAEEKRGVVVLGSKQAWLPIVEEVA